MVHYVLYDAHPVARCVPDSGNCLGATAEPAKCQEIPILVRNQRKAPQTVVCRLPSNLAEQTFRQSWVTDETVILERVLSWQSKEEVSATDRIVAVR